MMRFLLCCFFFFFSATVSAATDLEHALQQLQKTMSGVSTLQCSFVQKKTLAMFDDTLVSEGRLIFQQPDRLRWEYLAPVKSGFIVAGDSGRAWNTVSGKNKLFQVADNTEMQILTGQILKWTSFDLAALKKQYDFSLVANDPLQLSLVPKSKIVRRFLDVLIVTFSPDLHAVQRLEFKEVDGDVTTYDFSHAVINATVETRLVTP